jgi:hypothetical protein
MALRGRVRACARCAKLAAYGAPPCVESGSALWNRPGLTAGAVLFGRRRAWQRAARDICRNRRDKG